MKNEIWRLYKEAARQARIASDAVIRLAARFDCDEYRLMVLSNTSKALWAKVAELGKQL